MTRSQLMAVMVGGFATIAGSVMAAYIGILGDAYGVIAQSGGNGRELFAKHLLTASLMSAPAGLVMAKLMMPEVESPRPESVHALMTDEKTTRNLFDAAAAGASDGMRLALNVAAMLVAFVALLAMVNYPLAAILGPQWSIQNILGWVMTPIAWLCGVPAADTRAYGGLIGTQLVATEFVAYLDLAKHIKEGTMSPRSAQIATYALCGFCNFASIGIQIGGLSALAPERRSDLAALALRAMLAGAMACWMTACVASVLI
jgi:CNT family concentrative nucleoside transporter